MKSKLLAAKTALSLGVKVFIGIGNGKDKLIHILEGNGDGTYIGDDTAYFGKQPQDNGLRFILKYLEKFILMKVLNWPYFSREVVYYQRAFMK